MLKILSIWYIIHRKEILKGCENVFLYAGKIFFMVHSVCRRRLDLRKYSLLGDKQKICKPRIFKRSVLPHLRRRRNFGYTYFGKNNKPVCFVFCKRASHLFARIHHVICDGGNFSRALVGLFKLEIQYKRQSVTARCTGFRLFVGYADFVYPPVRFKAHKQCTASYFRHRVGCAFCDFHNRLHRYDFRLHKL